MKKQLILLAVLLIPIFVFSQRGYLYADVDNNYVTLWHSDAYRVCDFECQMEVSIDGNEIVWLQKRTAGGETYCLCYFDLPVTIGPLNDGLYNVGVFCDYCYVEPGYLGEIHFEIDTEIVTGSATVVAEFQGPCNLDVAIEETRKPRLQISHSHPNGTIEVSCTGSDPLISLSIFNQTGRKVFCNDIYGLFKTLISISNLPSGLYIIAAKTKSGLLTHKFLKH